MRILQRISLILFVAMSQIVFAQQNKSTIANSGAKKEFLTSAAIYYQKINEQSNPQILDARSQEEFDQSHLGKAIRVNPAEAGFEQLYANLDKQQPVFIYSIQTGRSTQLAQSLKKEGFSQLYVLAPGIAAWVGAGYPIIASSTNKNRVSLNDFKDNLISSKFVLVDYGSNYCPPCKKVIPVLDSLEKKDGNLIKTVKIDIDANPEIMKQFKIIALPTVILYKDGKEIWKKVGIPSVSEISVAALTN